MNKSESKQNNLTRIYGRDADDFGTDLPTG